MSKTTKFHPKLILVAKFVAVAVFIWILFRQKNIIKQINFKAFHLVRFDLLLLILILMPLNWYFEYLKWKVTLKHLNYFHRKESISSFLSGIFSGFITPNFIGNFAGRIIYYPFRLRPQLTLYTLLASYSQFLTTLSIGAVVLFFQKEQYQLFPSKFNWIICIFLLLGWMLYFGFEQLKPERIRLLSFFRYFRYSKKNQWLKLRFLIYNILRYFVFSLQYVLMLNVFQADFHWYYFLYVSIIYFWSTLIPSFIWGKLFIRETVALVILSAVIPNTNIILCSSLLLSVINQVIPAVTGIPFLMKKKKYE